MKTKQLKFPKRSTTLTEKIRKDNLWRCGDALADVVYKYWSEIQKCKDLHELANYFKGFGKTHYLAPYHVASTIHKAYL